MRKVPLLVWILLSVSVQVYAQKTVFIPAQFSNVPWNEWSWSKSYQSANFVVFWGNKVGTDPANYSNPDLRFDPAAICNYLEASYAKFVSEVGFVSAASSKPLGQYKIIIVMNDTYNGASGPTGWAFGGSYDNTIGAMWVHPGATRDPYVISHEFAHALQSQNYIQENTVGGGFINYEPAGWFWECHANYMRCVEFPQFAADDMPRWTATGSFHLSSTRHHYSTFKWLMHLQQTDGINMVNRLWRESVANEHPLVTLRRLKGWSQAQLNDFIFDYAKREAAHDYPAQSFGTYMRNQRNTFRTNPSENHYMWRVHTILDQLNVATGRYIVPDHAAPQDYGFNIIPLYTTCPAKTVHIKFKGHTEVNSTAGWRWGFVAVKANGTTVRYGTVSAASEGEATFTMAADETALYLVVVGAPATHTSYVWEPGWPKIKRYPYELRIENAVPEGYQENFRADVKALYAGHAHTNGGGWVANAASVSSSVYVGSKAIVVGNANLSGNVRVEGTARLEGVTASGSVIFGGDVNVYRGTYTNSAQVIDRAILNDCSASGSAIIKGNALAWGATYGNGVVVGGDAEIGNCSTPGVYLQTPHGNNGRANCDGKGAGDASNTDVNAAYTPFTDAQMGWTAIGCTSDTQAPSVPGTPEAGNITSNSVVLSWTASTDNVAVTGYDVIANGTVMLTVTGPSATVTGLSPATTYSFTIQAKDAAGNTSAASGARSVTTLTGGTSYLPRTGWAIQYYDSQETSGEDGAATNVLDGNNTSIWHTQWSNGSTGYPHEIQIDMITSYSVTGLACLPRQDGSTNGRIGGYQVYVSTDGTTWGTAVATGTWADNAAEKVVTFNAKTGRYVRLVATSPAVSGQAWASAAEINVIGTPVNGNVSNLALSATASTSYVSSWETLAAVNDGFTPASSNDKSNGAYGNWNNPNTIEWVQYDWPQPQVLTSTDVYWFDDNGGVRVPTTAYMEYWNGTAWVNIGNVPLVINAFNTLTINNVSTGRLRVSMLNTLQSTGILEWRVWGSDGTSSARITGAGYEAENGDEESADRAVTVYPNPVSSTFTVALSGFGPAENVTMKILDLQGREILNHALGTIRKTTFDTSALNMKGAVYVLRATGDRRVVTRKLVVRD